MSTWFAESGQEVYAQAVEARVAREAELAELIGDVQPNIAYWDASEKPPRSDVLPRLAKVLGVSVEDLLSADLLHEPKRGPVGRMQKVFADVSQLPRRQQAKII